MTDALSHRGPDYSVCDGCIVGHVPGALADLVFGQASPVDRRGGHGVLAHDVGQRTKDGVQSCGLPAVEMALERDVPDTPRIVA